MKTRTRRCRPGDLQLRILKVLWDRGAASVADVHETLLSDDDGDRLAYTTVATMLRKMEARALAKHSNEGRRFIYEAAVSEADVSRSMADDVLERVFEGNLADMVQHLLSARDVSPGELRELEQLIAERKKQS